MKVKAPKEDPAAKAAREREQERAEATFVESAQEVLDDETEARRRRFGRRAALAGVRPGGAGTFRPISRTPYTGPAPRVGSGGGDFGTPQGGTGSTGIVR